MEGTGGAISIQNSKEQLLYEVIDPGNYFTPDVVADFQNVHFEQIESGQIKVSGGNGKTKPETLKVSLGYQDGVIGQGEISYAGANATDRVQNWTEKSFKSESDIFSKSFG